MNSCKLCCRLSGKQADAFKSSLTWRWMYNKWFQPSGEARLYSSRERPTKAQEVEEEALDKPYSFSTSKAAKWSVDKSFGSQYARPLWKVVPLSLGLIALISWVFLRSETELDRRLEVTLSEHLPDLFQPPETDPEGSESQEVDVSTS